MRIWFWISVFFSTQKTAYDMRVSDWSSDVCSSDLLAAANDAARCPGSAAVVVESWGRLPALDLTAGRRLALGASGAGTVLLILRFGAEPTPSVAETQIGRAHV